MTTPGPRRPGLGTLAAFVAELRAIGLPVSVSENVDAMAAVLAMPLGRPRVAEERAGRHAGQEQRSLPAFEAGVRHVLRRQPSRRHADLGPGSRPPTATSAAANGAGRDGHRRRVQRRRAQRPAVPGRAAGDQFLIRAVVAEAVSRYAGHRARPGLWPGCTTSTGPCGGSTWTRLLERLLAAGGPADLSANGPRPWPPRRRRGQVDGVRTEAEAEIRRRLVADRGAEAVAGTLRVSLPEDVDFLNASPQQLAAIRQAVQVLEPETGRAPGPQAPPPSPFGTRLPADDPAVARQRRRPGRPRLPEASPGQAGDHADRRRLVVGRRVRRLHAATGVRDQVRVLPGPELCLHRRHRGDNRVPRARRRI